MSKEEKRVPELRFEGFHDDWKQRKLSELMTFSNGINAPKENYGKGRKMISVMDILQEAPIKYENIRNSVKVDEKIEAKNKVENGDLVFVRSSEVREEVGWAKAYLEEKYALYSGFSIRGKKQNEFNSHFIELTLNSVNRKQLERKAGGSTRFNVSQNILNNVKIFSPTIEEQNKIDKLFKIFNDAITLHQRKLEQLRELKKAALQTLFPQKTETEPRVRFANFNEPWKARKLGDYLSIPKKEKKVVKKSDELITVKLNLGGVVLGSSRDTLSLGATAYYVRHSGQLIYGKQNFFNGSIAIIPDNLDGKASSGDVPSFDIININSDYLYTFISRPVYWKQKEAFASGTGSKRIHESTFLNFDICLPNTYDEQQAIGCYFKKLEKLTILYQSKLERLLSLKKSFLQKMFI
ncbi:restriction endonuclease subunit S [Tetragenococcus halophilus]|uniref:restriction endonuclease subunit S n=1 Tax=Tetragenococcus halophilus TaxID=51669 RepID=UPI00300F8F1D